ncbi:MAG: ATP synthase F0 subunit B [Desulfobacteraceae bacterium]|nr:ATP synthase F0 subunit B [Desulfobacteraceae bacterium]
MEIISTVSMISINETLIVQMISFLIFLYLINRIMFRPLQGVMRQRNEKIDSLGRDIEDSRIRLTNMHQQLEDQKKAAVEEANKNKIELESEGSEQAEEILGESQKEIESIRQENEKFINGQITDARQTLQDETARLAENMMEKILDRGLVRG